MKTIVTLFCVASFMASLFIATDGKAEEQTDRESGRYQLEEIKVDNVQTPVLLDTVTGKLWMYRFDSMSGKSAFVGTTVEGLAYSRKDVEEIDRQIQLWHVDGIVDKNVKNFRTMLISELSYFIDSAQARKIKEPAKARAEH